MSSETQDKSNFPCCHENEGCSVETPNANTPGEADTVAAATALASFTSNNPDNDYVHDDGFEIPQRFTKSGRKRAVPFPMKLMKVLSTKEFSDIISWTPSGKSFSIKQPKAFVAQILPEHFKSAKYSSFTRKLHRWGFMRHYRGDESGAFYHNDFQRDRLDLAEQMSCYKSEPPKAATAIKTFQSQPSRPQPSAAVADTEADDRQTGEPASSAATKAVAAPVVAAARREIAAAAFQPAVQQRPPQPQPSEVMARLQQQQQTLKTADLAAERINAVIEAEVTRRLNERIQAAQKAALSRLAVMQQLGTTTTSVSRPTAAITAPPPPPQPPAAVVPAPRQQWNMAAGNLKAQLLLLQQKNAACFGGRSGGMPRMDTRGLDDLPCTNIQGAKTA